MPGSPLPLSKSLKHGSYLLNIKGDLLEHSMVLPHFFHCSLDCGYLIQGQIESGLIWADLNEKDPKIARVH